MVNYYDYEELKNKALEKRDKQSIMDLYNWFSRYGNDFYNGECYSIDKELNLYPIWSGVGEPDEDGDYEEYEVISAEIR